MTYIYQFELKLYERRHQMVSLKIWSMSPLLLFTHQVVSDSFCDPMDCSPLGSSCLWDFTGKNTGMGYRFLLQGIFPT